MMKKILVLCLGLASFSNVWADNTEDLKNRYDALNDEQKEEYKRYFKSQGWMELSDGGDFKSYANYDYVKASSYGVVEVWLKSIVVNDLTKDGLSLGDYSMELIQYNCNDRTSKYISYTDYSKKTGKVLKSYTFPSYEQFKAVIPGSIGEARLDGVCLMNHVKTH